MEFIAENKRMSLELCHFCVRLDLKNCASCKDGISCNGAECASFMPAENIAARMECLIEKIGTKIGE